MGSEPKVLLWDIESTSLNADFGTILCIGWKWLGGKRVYVADIHEHGNAAEPWDDSGLVEFFVNEVYDKADYTVAHYGQRFDLPMIVTKCVKYGIPVPAPKVLVDTWRISRDNLKLHNNRLDSIAKYFVTLDQKTGIMPDEWRRAMCGDRKALRYVVDHCRADILVLDEVFKRLRPLARNEPSRHLFEPLDSGCVSCGSSNLHRRGYHVARTYRYQRYQCQACGKWQRARTADKGPKAALVG